MRKTLIATCFAALLSLSVAGMPARGQALSEQNFAQVQQLIAPHEGEGLWRHIPWETDLTAARRKAAEQGKPLLIWAGGGSAPLGGC